MLLRAESLRPSSCSWGTQVAPNSKIKAAQTLVMSRVLTTNCIGPVCAVPSLLARLDDAPSLTRDEVATSVLNAVAVSSIVSAMMPFVTWTDQISWTNQMLAATMSFLMVMAVYMNSFIEAQYSGHCSAVTALADQDSHFVSIEGTHVHAKRQTASGKLHRTMHCFHGFGAALDSWDSIKGSLAAQCDAVVTAHDMPGFGLSESGKRILVGHSMGGASAVAAALLRPQEVAALVLIAPTVMASSGVVPLEVCELGVVGTAPLINFNIAVQPHQSSRQRSKDSMPSSWQNRRHACRRLLRVLASCCLRASYPFVILPLRSMVRSKHFWQRGLEVSRFDTSKVTPALIDIYRRPMLVKGWEQGLVNFAAARIAGDIPLRLVLQDIWTGRNRQTSAELLKNAVQDHNIKVLIIHGAEDNVIPVSNSIRLAQMIPGASLKVLDCVGHIPQEESPDEIIEIITKFLSESQV